METFRWRHSWGAGSLDYYSSCNIWGNKGEGKTVDDEGMVREEEGMLFV